MFKDKVLNEITVSLRDKILIIENELNILSEEKNNIYSPRSYCLPNWIIYPFTGD